MREIKLDIIFWDTIDISTVEHVTAEKAYRENFIEFVGDKLVPTDKCTIIRQYIGLKDKNGKEIYEGDLYKQDGRIWEVTFIKDCYMGSWTQGLGARQIHYKEIEIIGNKWQTPKLEANNERD